ncbi:MAG: DUF4870 domain-containing protein [Verrucomicrobiae bacterium]|nr:DUF4870 domain-containing protein [Verrucomicrobiae bacterium]
MPGPTPMSVEEERQWAMFLHLSAFSGFVIPFGSIVAPLVMWLVRRDRSAFVDEQGKEAVNFQISILIYTFISIPLCFVLIGFFTLFAASILEIIFTIMAAVRASEGRHYRYPLTIRMIT